MQGNVLGQSGSGLKIDELIKEYKVASGGNVSAGDFVKFVEKYNLGTDTRLTSRSSTGEIISAVVLSSSKVFIAFAYNTGSGFFGVVCTINGNTITPRHRYIFFFRQL